MKEKIIRGRRVIFESADAKGSWLEYLRYSLDVFDERESLVEVLGRRAADRVGPRCSPRSSTSSLACQLPNLPDGELPRAN